MEDKKLNVDELIKQCRDETYKLTEQLQNEKVVEFTDYSMDDLKVVDFSDDFSTIDAQSQEERNLAQEEIKADSDEKLSAEEIDELNKLEAELEDEEEQEVTNVKQLVDYSNNPTIIDFENVTMRYNKVDKLIEGLNLKIHEGEFIYLVGPSGAGKSTLSRLIYRDVNNVGGTVWVDGINATRLKPHDLHKLRKKIGVIFQDYKLLPDLTIYQNVKYTLDVIGYPKKKKDEQVLKTLEKVGIKDQKDKYPNELSGGQQQRAAIARAIVNEPKIIVADEPTGNLDVKNADIVMKILERIHKSGTTVIMATHDTKIVNKYKHRTLKIESGGIKGENKQGGYIYE